MLKKAKTHSVSLIIRSGFAAKYAGEKTYENLLFSECNREKVNSCYFICDSIHG